MKIVVVYVFPVSGQFYFDGACRFVDSYARNDPGIEHELIAIANGGPPSCEMRSLLDLTGIKATWFEHDNSGYDIGAEQSIARQVHCDMMVFFGSTAYIRGPNWLKRMAEAFEHNGPQNIYGCMANTGDIPVGVWPHIRTTGYWLNPMMMNMYPIRVDHPALRYEFEHGKRNITEWFRQHGRRALMVTWNHACDWPLWNRIPNGFHTGNQSELITGDKISAPPFYKCP